MPETKAHARARARRLGFPLSNVVKGKRGYYIAPRGIRSKAGKRAYAAARSSGHSKAYSAKVAWSVEHHR